MARDERFTFLCSRDERQIIAHLAKQLQRTQSDTIRFIVVSAARELTNSHESGLTPKGIIDNSTPISDPR